MRTRSFIQARLRPRRPILRGVVRLVPIAQVAGAAVLAYYVATLLPVHEQRPVFASIAAVVALGATDKRRGVRSLELIGGVVLGLTVADLIVQAIGTGLPQIGLMIVLAMGVGRLLGGSELLVTEAAVSGLLLSLLGPGDHGLSVDRFLEALTGGAVAFTVSFLMFPPDPVQMVSRASDEVFSGLSGAIDQVSGALADRDPGRAAAALREARGIDAHVEELEDALVTASETARLAPLRRGTGEVLDRYRRTLSQVDFAVRNGRVLARHSLRYSRGQLPAPDGLADLLHELAEAVRMLAAAYDDPQHAARAEQLARAAGAQARAIFDREADLELTAILIQARSLAADLLAAAELLGGAGDAPEERASEELLDAVPMAA
jgi:uncharacterized membrane protein YgaE (UPF0421/DUF939 family)